MGAIRFLVYGAIFCFGFAAGAWSHKDGFLIMVIGIVLAGFASIIDEALS